MPEIIAQSLPDSSSSAAAVRPSKIHLSVKVVTEVCRSRCHQMMPGHALPGS
ncbi:hypothetical protein N658DRAFT_495987 [Parathielavia hyrcaniae]|uniref:Uncharacterized protein n=1 Tax=Parathielavia hyrcaniae TaxID=113614 RepID=A0AAN6Q0Y2_9PEZI|nr:hypothetical protein N658DRAFT_495987 [Parathielavia hyrcaniae]